MATNYNIPSQTTDSITLGQCILYGQSYTTPTAAGVTPYNNGTDFGTIDEVTLEVTRTLLSCKQGTPQRTTIKHCIEEVGTLNVKGWEWNIENMYRALGAGTTAITGSSERYDFGGTISVANLQLEVFHRTPTGATISLDIWKCSGNGALTYPFNPSDYNKFDYSFDLWNGTSDWLGTTLSAGSQLYRYRRLNAS